MRSFPRRSFLATASLLLVMVAACGGDSGSGPVSPGHPQPEPPAGSATQVPRVLGLSRIDGKSVPVMHYTSSTYNSDAWTDSGTATLQDDSLLVVRTYTRWVARGAGTQAPATQDTFTTGGRLRSDGIAIFPYTDGTADTAYVHANGAIEAHLSLNESGVQRPFGVFLFAAAYKGGTLNPMPYVHVISPDTAAQFADSVVVTLAGSSFLPTTRASWDNSPLSVGYVSPNQIMLTIPGSDLLVASTHALTITNPGPGGGARTFQFPVTVPEPVITSISPMSVVANGGDFTLHVHGRGFIQGKTQVLWNGSPRLATVASQTDLMTTIANADIASAGTYQVAVQTSPPGGGTTGVIPLTALATGGQKISEVAAAFGANTLIFDPTRSLVYALPNISETMYPHSLVAIDPTTGNIVWALDLGTWPAKMAMADDGSYLYAAAGDTLFRVSLATHSIALRIPIAMGNSWVNALAVMPGQPRTVAMQYSSYSGAMLLDSISVFDDAQVRPSSAVLQGEPGPPIAFSSPQTLHAFTNNRVNNLAVSSSGVTIAAQNVAQVGTGTVYIDGTRAFTGGGAIYDLASHASSQVPNMPSGYAVALSVDGGTMYSIDDTSPFLRAYNTVTGAEIGVISFTTSPSTPRLGSIMIRWGKDGVAFTLLKSVVFLRADFVN